VKLDRVLVPLNGSALAESALGKAAELAGGDSTTLMLLRAADAPTLPGVDATEAPVRLTAVLRGTTTPILLVRAPEAPVESPRAAGQAPTRTMSHA
jgi:hypothetical protein